MKKLLVAATILLLVYTSAGAQTFLQQSPLQNRPAGKPVRFQEVQQAFDRYWENQSPSDTESENAEEGGYQQFKRWEWFMEQRTFPSGIFPSPEVLYNEYQGYKTQYGSHNARMASNWSFIGPHVVPANGGGAGRINCLAFDPANANVLWAGAACGGLWKSTDGGATWSSNTDLLPSLSISDIVIDPSNPQIMYLATGDKYGIYWQYETWGHYSAGILKSTDGGVTWNPTGLNFAMANVTVIQRLIIDPSNTNTLYAATNMGVFKSTDAAATWANIRPGKFYDIEMNPGNNMILYTGDSTGVFRTTNAGASWSAVPGVTSTGRTSICVTPANSAAVYVWSEGGALYYSNNSGVSFTTRTDPTTDCTPYGYYDMVIDVSPVNENILFTGGLNVARSTDGGNSWTVASDWGGWPNANYVHADNHALQFGPASSNTIYSCNDGGIFRSADQGNTWSDLSGGIDIKQYYRLSGSFITPSVIYAGAQDNGTDRVTGVNAATQVNGADGEECLVDFTDDNIVFVSSQSGYFMKSTDGGASFTALSQFGCDWTSPIIMDQTDHNNMYLGGSDVYRSTDNGDTWNNVSNGAFDGTCVYSLEISPTSPSYVYAATFGNIYRTTNGGTSWSTITGSLPVGQAAISGIAISDGNPDAVWVTLSGFAAGEKVYYTTNGGVTWTNMTGSLPNVPANCIEYQNGSNDLLYVGTDLGVFYMDATMNDWLPYNNGLPNVIIDELEIHYPTSKLRAATYGRGLWESDLQVSTLMNVDASALSMVNPPSSTCDTVITPVVNIRNGGVDTLHTVDLFYRIDAQAWQQYSWSGSLASFATASIPLNTYTLTAGPHTLKAYTTNPNASADQNHNNDTLLRTFTILSAPTTTIALPVAEGFVSAAFPPANFSLENSSSLWTRTTSTGGYQLSANAARANFYSISSGTDALQTLYVDFSSALPPIRLYFDLAYAPYPGYVDSLVIDLYSDCAGGERLYAKGSSQLLTSPSTTGQFVPASAGQWRTDTLHLDSLAGHGPMQIRFLAKSGYGNDLFIDNINLNGNGVGIAEQPSQASFVVYPNPAATTITLELPFAAANAEVAVFDLYGKRVMGTELKAGTTRTTMDVSALSEGVYLVQVTSNGHVETKRLAIVR